jgi:RHS repeat-associated protein
MKNKYDETGRLINISHADNQKTYADYDITWDNGNRITDFDFTYLNGPAKKNQSNYSYDKTSQLTSATYNFMQDERYNFDLNGNRIKAEIQNKEQTYKTAEYNRLISDNDSEYKYDLEGNRISKISNVGSTIKYYWDNRNRLVKIETPNGSIEYIYDHQNRIVLRKQGETKTTFIHDGWQIILQFDNDKPTHRYLWGTKQDELICDNDNWTLNDHLNTIRDIVKSDGAVESHLEYNSFGKIISTTKNDSSLQFAYTGKLTDKVSELQWNINRWYDAKVGRWVSEDPIGFEANDVNLYRYVLGKMPFTTDVFGLLVLPPGVQTVVAGVAGCAAAGAYTIFRAWWKNESACQCKCKGIGACISGGIAGVLFTLAPGFAVNCGISGANAVYTAVIAPACDVICGKGNVNRLVCGIASGIFKALAGCVAQFLVTANARMESVVLAVVAQIYGENTASVCSLAQT